MNRTITKDYESIAMQNFLDGYNCSQSVVLAFNDIIGMDKSNLLKLTSSFGGGFSRMREICGAVSGIGFVLGYLYGYDSTSLLEKEAHYKLIQNAANRFKMQTGSIICREILKLRANEKITYVPEARSEEYYKKRPCCRMVGIAAKIIQEIIEEKNELSH